MGTAHYFAAERIKMGFDVKLTLPAHVNPSVKRGKNDAMDTAACCEDAAPPATRFVPVKSCVQTTNPDAA